MWYKLAQPKIMYIIRGPSGMYIIRGFTEVGL